jgi:hypothetical protein
MMAHKIRKAMADRDAKYTLAALVEVDESFLAIVLQEKGAEVRKEKNLS